MQKAINEQNSMMKSFKNDVIEKQNKINRLEEFIEQANNMAMNEHL